MSKLTRFLERSRVAARKRLWQFRNNCSPNAKAVFVLGAQRSGTTMLIRCLNESAELEVYGEASAAMKDWRLKDNETVAAVVRGSRSKAVVFKPLTESHRARELLEIVPNAVVIWVYRRAADRANSAVARFRSNNLEFLSAFVRGERLDSWQAQGLSESSLSLLRKYDFQTMSPHSAAGLFWYIRNSLYFEQGLDNDARVLTLAYEDLVSMPEKVMDVICRFIDCAYDRRMTSSIHARSVGRSESHLDPDIEAMCEKMYVLLKERQGY